LNVIVGINAGINVITSAVHCRGTGAGTITCAVVCGINSAGAIAGTVSVYQCFRIVAALIN